MPEAELPRAVPVPGTLRLVERAKETGLAGLADDGWRIVHRHAHTTQNGKLAVVTAVRLDGEAVDGKDRAENAKHCAALDGLKSIFSREWTDGPDALRVIVLKG